jgi:hypothetical protein
LNPVLTPAFSVGQWTDQTSFIQKIVSFSSSTPSAIQITRNSAILSGNHFKKVTITAQTIACDDLAAQNYPKDVTVNIRLQKNGDTGLKKQDGTPVTPVAVGESQDMYLFIFAKTRLQVLLASVFHVFSPICLLYFVFRRLLSRSQRPNL